MSIKIIEYDSLEYPDILKEIHDPPKVLYCIGNTDLFKECGIAVVGTRRSSPYGRWASFEISRKIAECGAVVISGMAEGIDSEAHLGCLDGHGNTIAVLGTGIDICFPKSNRQLYNKIAEKGLLISEYPPGDKGRSYYFPQRNRIISGLSKAVIVVEGALKSGSMITANLALSQGRDVFAVPGNINQPNSIGVNSLIRDGAMPIMSVDDVPAALGIGNIKKKLNRELSREETVVLACVTENPGTDQDIVCLKTGLDISKTLQLLSILEIKGLIRREGNFLYSD